MSNFLRGLQGNRTDDDDEQPQPQKYSETRQPVTRAPQQEIETPSVMKENAAIAKKASAFIGTVTEAYSAPEPRAAVKVADFDDIEGVKNRQKKWEDGQVVREEEIRANPDGYKVDETEEIKARKQKWEEGQVVRAEGIKANPDGYKVDETEELKARKQKWEGGQVIGSTGATPQPEGYKLNDSVGVKDRLNKWSQVASNVPVISPKKPVSLTEGEDSPDPSGTTPRSSKDRAKQWEEGSVSSPTRDSSKASAKEEVGDVGVKDRLNKWSEVTKDPEPAPGRKEPMKIYEEGNQ